TEASPVTHQTWIVDPVEKRITTVGRPLDHTEARIVDPGTFRTLGTGEVAVLGVLGADPHAYELRRALIARGIRYELCFPHPDFVTFTYTKLLNITNQEEDQPRIDFVNTKPLPAEAEVELIRRLEEAAPAYDVLLVSDQAETGSGGVITAAVREALGPAAADYVVCSYSGYKVQRLAFAWRKSLGASIRPCQDFRELS
ncbi:MAG: hypothetical protein JNL62_29695, partial [Bryobacterales bacterium]|nr:hypothetical protein [Bryobacterales bacterium]